MKSTIVFTSTLSGNLMSWLTNHAQKKNQTKRAIIEEALKAYQEKVRIEELKDTFKRAKIDTEITEMAEENLNDYEEQLNSLGL